MLEFFRDLGGDMFSLAIELYQQNKYRPALFFFKFALTFYVCNGTGTPYESPIPTIETYIAKTLLALREYEEAYHFVSLAINDYEHGEDDPPMSFLEVGSDTFCQAIEFHENGRHEDALPMFKFSLRIYIFYQSRPPYAPPTEPPTIKTYIAKTLYAMQDYEGALDYCNLALSDYHFNEELQGYGSNNPFVLEIEELADQINVEMNSSMIARAA